MMPHERSTAPEAAPLRARTGERGQDAVEDAVMANTSNVRPQTSLIPAAADLVRHSQLEYNAMLIGVFDLLRARQEQVEAGGSYIEALRDYWVARVELERAIGGELPPGENTADTERGPDERANGAARPQEGTHEPMHGHEHGHHGHGHEE